jgi:hypothetical protein
MRMTVKERLHHVVDELPEEEAEVVLRYAERLRGLDLAELRGRLEAFAEEWDSPEMDVYDAYDTGNGRG